MKKSGSRLYCTYLLFAIFIIFVEWINFFLYFANTRLPVGVAESVAAGLLFLFVFFTKGRLEYEKSSLNLEKTIGYLLIVCIGFFMSVFPDRTFDTGNYHLIAQNPAFEDYFTEDFGYGNFQVWGFRLPDRMFYYFRYLLGYRLGTLLNVFVMVVSFTQLYDLLDWVFLRCTKNPKDNLKSKIVCNRLIWSLSILCTLDTILLFGTYYVDLLSIPFALELIRLLLDEKDQEPVDIYYFALICGITLGLKLTNIIYVAPIVIIYVIANRRKMKIKHWVYCIFIGAFPFASYLLFNYICTGNPIFPYFNEIFQSRFFPNLNWKDTRWGPNNLFEKFCWIFYAAFKPEYRQSEIFNNKPAVLVFGLLSTLLMGIIKILRKRKGYTNQFCFINIQLLALITIISTVLWSFTTGYSRYFIFGSILWGVLAYYFFSHLSSHFDVFGEIVSTVCSAVVVVCLCTNLTFVLKGSNWSWQIYTFDEFKHQLHYVFHDLDITTDYEIRPDMYVITSPEYMGVAELINSDVYVENTSYTRFVDDKYQSICKNRREKAELMYDIHATTFTQVVDYVHKMDSLNLYITDFLPVSVGSGNYYLIDVQNKSGSGSKNSVWISNEGLLEILQSPTSSQTLSFLCGRFFDWELAPKVFLQIYGVDESGNQRDIAFVPVDNQKVQKYRISLDEDFNSLLVNVCYSNGKTINTDDMDQVFLINWKLE